MRKASIYPAPLCKVKRCGVIAILTLLLVTPVFNVLAVGTNYRYTGQELDPTGLYYYGQRYYDPNVGRFTQPDPLANYLTDPQKLKQTTGQDLQKFLENPQNLNPYSYVQNNPVRYVDPTGEWWKELFTGQQSLSSFYGEVGEAAMYVNPVMSTAIDHPYVTGAIAGLGAGLGVVFAGIAAGTAPWQLAAAGSAALPIATQVAQRVDKFLQTNSVPLNKFQEVGENFIAEYGGKVNSNLLSNLYKEAGKMGMDQAVINAQKSINTFLFRIGEHINKYQLFKESGGYVSKPLTEIMNYSDSIKTLEKFISNNLK